MAKRKVSRVAAKKVKDKWKSKVWYTVRAPPMYNSPAIAETLADEPEKLMGRIAEATLQDLTGDFSKMHVKMKFKIAAVRGNECGTKFVGHELTSDYVRRLTRRKHSKIDVITDVVTRDGFTIRVKPMAITERRAQTSQMHQIRALTTQILLDAGKSRDHAELIKDVVNGEIAQVIYKEARKIYPLKRVEIRRSQIMSEPEAFFETVDLFARNEEPEAEEPTEDVATETADDVADEAGAEDAAPVEADEAAEDAAPAEADEEADEPVAEKAAADEAPETPADESEEDKAE